MAETLTDVELERFRNAYRLHLSGDTARLLATIDADRERIAELDKQYDAVLTSWAECQALKIAAIQERDALAERLAAAEKTINIVAITLDEEATVSYSLIDQALTAYQSKPDGERG